MSYIVVDVESDGPLLGTNSMVCFGAVKIDERGLLDQNFYAQTAPIGDNFDPEALAISGFTRQQHQTFEQPKVAMLRFKDWIDKYCDGRRPTLLSDNNGYDASWINWYFHTFIGENPFGWTSRRIGDMFAGFMNDPYYQWKKHRRTPHSHHPVDDARSNAEALLWLQKQGFKIKFR